MLLVGKLNKKYDIIDVVIKYIACDGKKCVCTPRVFVWVYRASTMCVFMGVRLYLLFLKNESYNI